MSWYEILSVDKATPPEDIKKAYKKLVLIHHPDKGGDAEQFKIVQNAYEESLIALTNYNIKPKTGYDFKSKPKPKKQSKPKQSPKEKRTPIPKEENPRSYEYYNTTKGNISNMRAVFEEIVILRQYNNRITNKVLGALIRLRGLTELKTTGMPKDELLFILFLEVPDQMIKDTINILNIQLDGTENKKLLIKKLLTSLVYYL